MTKKEEKELVKLLTKLYKKDWNFNWITVIVQNSLGVPLLS